MPIILSDRHMMQKINVSLRQGVKQKKYKFEKYLTSDLDCDTKFNEKFNFLNTLPQYKTFSLSIWQLVVMPQCLVTNPGRRLSTCTEHVSLFLDLER